MSKTHVLEKIQKVLARAASSNAHEAEVAMAMAQDLMLRHNLTLQEVEGAAPADPIGESLVPAGKGHCVETEYITALLRKYFFVRVILTSQQAYKGGRRVTVEASLNFVGRSENVAIAQYVYTYLKRTFRSLFRAYKNSAEGQAHLSVFGVSEHTLRKSFYHGLYAGLNQKLEAERGRVEQEMGLVLVEDADLQAYVDGMNVRTKTGRSATVNAEAFQSGQVQGQAISLRTSVGGKGDSRLLLA